MQNNCFVFGNKGAGGEQNFAVGGSKNDKKTLRNTMNVPYGRLLIPEQTKSSVIWPILSVWLGDMRLNGLADDYSISMGECMDSKKSKSFPYSTGYYADLYLLEKAGR